ncbi:DNA polymerase IV [Brevibacillus daliensis]|uniref:DNA polymerase IV n=1 Tax=Brevibacillus daliensis TaxID=2892995 RepID=UPI001E601A0D|nr:DNA polymerase IV [Brevibacillus daliensis]
MKKFIHLDIDAFYASVEQLDHPEYLGHPVIVGGTGNRGVVATCSYEAREFGVHSAMPVAIARRKCPQGIFVPCRFDRYHEKSAEIRAIFTDYAELFETVGLDEAYLDVSHYDNAVPVAKIIKERIRLEAGLTCSIGLSYNMSLAKIASDLRKPDAFVIIRPEEALDILAPLPIGVINGIGKKSQEVLKRRHIETVRDLWEHSEEELVQLFGKWGHALYQRARGIDYREIKMERSVKSISRETTLIYDLHERERIIEVARELLEEIKQESEDEQVMPQTLTLKIRYTDFTTRSKQRKVEAGSNWEEWLEYLVDDFDFSKGVRLIGAGFSNFLHIDEPGTRFEQLTMFQLPSWKEG